MLEPDVTLTDLVLAVQCAAFSILLFRKRDGSPLVRRLYAVLFGALGASSLFGGLWHGVFSGRETALGQWVWLCVMAALAVAAASLWLISAALLSSAKWACIVRRMASLQLIIQLSVSAFVTDGFAVAAIGLLPPLSVMIAVNAVHFGRTGARKALYGMAGFSLAALAGLVIAFDVSLHPRWATTLAVYHMIQFVAFCLVFMSVPVAAAHPR